MILDEKAKSIDQKINIFFDTMLNFIWSYIFHVLKYVIMFFEGLLIAVVGLLYAFIPILNPKKIQFKNFSHKEN